MADILRGNTSLSKIYRGTTEVSKVYKGQTEIWSSGPGPSPLPDPTLTDLYWWYDAGRTSSYPGSGTTINDLSGNGYNGTLVNTPTFTSGDSGYFTLNGTSQYISFSPGTSTFIPNNTSLTFEFVVRSTDSTSRRTILSQWGSATADQTLQVTRLESGNGNNLWLRSGLGTENDLFAGTYGASGNWEHWMLVMTYGTPGADDFSSIAYLNNVDQGSVNTWTDYSAWRATTQQFRWGANGDNTQYMQGDIAVMRMYTKALDSTERTANYDLENSRYSF